MVQTYFVINLLVAFTAATIPDTVYRGVGSNPDIVKGQGGFKCRGGDFGEPKDHSMDLYTHVTMNPDSPGHNTDPWISTSKSYDWVKGYMGRHKKGRTVHIYHIRTKGLKNIFDIADYCKAKGLPYLRSVEQEVSVKDFIPWSNIADWDSYHVSNDGQVTPMPKYTLGTQKN